MEEIYTVLIPVEGKYPTQRFDNWFRNTYFPRSGEEFPAGIKVRDYVIDSKLNLKEIVSQYRSETGYNKDVFTLMKDYSIRAKSADEVRRRKRNGNRDVFGLPRFSNLDKA